MENPQDKVERLFEEALGRPEEEREAFLKETCGDAALRKEVSSLVEAYEEAPAFFEGLASSVVAPMLSKIEGEGSEGEGSAASDPLELGGTSLGRYLVEEHLGSGGMGVVYRARDTELDRLVALKFLPPHLSWHEEAEERFVREARAAATLDHPSVATVYEIGEAALGRREEHRRFIAMAYYEGETLKEKLSRERTLPIEEALSYARQIAEGLGRAHEAGIIHRDIKPANVMVTERGRVKLLDFGIAKLKGTQGITETGSTVGTVAYMAPEQIQGKEIDGRADLFSLGVVLYEMLTGRHPFPGEYRQAIAYQIIQEEAEPPSTYREELPAELNEVVLQCLEKAPEDRYDSAEEVLSALQKAMPETGSSSSRMKGPAPEAEGLLSGHSWLKRRRMVGLGALAVMALLAGWWLLGGSASEEAGEAVPGESEPEITERSVAVLPFTNLSAGEEVTSVTRGLHDDLLARLSNIGDLQVTSRTSVERYRGTELSLPAIAESLGVRWIVEGGVQEARGQVQVNAQLIDPETDVNVWADQYQRELIAENLFAIQEEIAEEIAGALEAELTAGEQERIAGAPTENLEAYRHYVRGRQELDQSTSEENLRQAAEQFRQALQEDSTYALAWTGLADAVGKGLYEAYSPDSLRLPEVSQEAAARRALELEPDLAEAHAALGYVYFRQREGPAALQALRRAIELKPSYAEAHQGLGSTYLVLGRLEEGLEHLKLAEELNPQHVRARHALYDAYLASGQANQSLEEAREHQRMYPDLRIALWAEVRALYELGQFEEAARIARERLGEAELDYEEGELEEEALEYERLVLRSYLVAIEAAAGDTSRAREHMRALQDLSLPPEVHRHVAFLYALAHSALGNLDAAFAEYRKISDWGWAATIGFRHLLFTEARGPLQDDPRYEELIQEINVQWGLNPDGSLPEEDEGSAAEL